MLQMRAPPPPRTAVRRYQSSSLSWQISCAISLSEMRKLNPRRGAVLCVFAVPFCSFCAWPRATIEIGARTGEENFFLFGQTEQPQVADSGTWYNTPHSHYDHEQDT